MLKQVSYQKMMSLRVLSVIMLLIMVSGAYLLFPMMAPAYKCMYGLVTFIFMAFTFSENQRMVPWKTVLFGVLLQFLMAIFVLKTPYGLKLFSLIQSMIDLVNAGTMQATSFVFGDLANPNGKMGFVFAFQVLSIIIVVGGVMSLLYYTKIMNPFIKGLSWVMMKTMKLSGAESLASTANIFLGPTESALVVKPFLAKMTRSELFALLVGSFSNMAISVVMSLSMMKIDITALLTSSLISAASSLYLAKIIIPETQTPETNGKLELKNDDSTSNVMEAVMNGIMEAGQSVLYIVFMLIGFIALIYLLNQSCVFVGSLFGLENFSFNTILGYLFSPFALLMGVDSKDVHAVGQLLGTKISVNEFVAFLDLLKMQELSDRSRVLAVYALSGFANFSCVAIAVAGISVFAPEQKKTLSQIGIKAMLTGFLATLVGATIGGILM